LFQELRSKDALLSEAQGDEVVCSLPIGRTSANNHHYLHRLVSPIGNHVVFDHFDLTVLPVRSPNPIACCEILSGCAAIIHLVPTNRIEFKASFGLPILESLPENIRRDARDILRRNFLQVPGI
jgi:hypothetical protein